MKRLTQNLFLLLILLAPWQLHGAESQKKEKLDGYLEYRYDDVLIIDGQRVRAARDVKFKGKGKARDVDSIPLGYECKAEGSRQTDGVILVHKIEVKPNGSAMFEGEVKEATDDAEAEYRRAGRFFESDDEGRDVAIGRLHDSGRRVARVRRIMDSLIPPYMDPEDTRVYVIEHEEWNAFAMGNYSFYAFTGLLDDMDDDEVAIILGHELVHASHEHTRKHFKRNMWIQLAALGAMAATEQIDSETKQAILGLATGLVSMAYSNGYGRNLEDQADRVGLRYAYEAGYDVSKGPALWRRFAKRYGEEGRVVNFFFGSHSRASKRAEALERELALNYGDGAKKGARRRAATRTVVEPREPSKPSSGGSWTAISAVRSKRDRLRQGMTLDEVADVLGDPEDEISFGESTRWHYSDFTVVFRRGRLEEVRDRD